jgi:hypothetical protein
VLRGFHNAPKAVIADVLVSFWPHINVDTALPYKKSYNRTNRRRTHKVLGTMNGYQAFRQNGNQLSESLRLTGFPNRPLAQVWSPLTRDLHGNALGGLTLARVFNCVQPSSKALLQVLVIIEREGKRKAIFSLSNETFYASLLVA